MKKLKYLALVALLVPVMVVLTACGGRPSELRGTWEPEFGTYNLVLESNGDFTWGELEGTWSGRRVQRRSENVPIIGRVRAAHGTLTLTPTGNAEVMEFVWLTSSMPAIEILGETIPAINMLLLFAPEVDLDLDNDDLNVAPLYEFNLAS